jgi:isoamylase
MSVNGWAAEQAVSKPPHRAVFAQLRNRQVKNFLTVTMLSAGMPIFLMGDEARRTQSGNNNAYCQDNETSWFDWTLVAKHANVHRFVTELNARRVFRELEPERERVCLTQLLRGANLSWHGVKLGHPDWGESSHSIAFTGGNPYGKDALSLDIQRLLGGLGFELPRLDKTSENPWRRWIDTALDSPHDILQSETAESPLGYVYRGEN